MARGQGGLATLEATMTGWRRRVLVIGVLVVAVFAATTVATLAYETYVDSLPDRWSGSVICTDGDEHPQYRGILVLAVILPVGLLLLPASLSAALLDVAPSDLETGSAGWVLLLAANATFWALVLYGTYAGILNLRRRRLGT